MGFEQCQRGRQLGERPAKVVNNPVLGLCNRLEKQRVEVEMGTVFKTGFALFLRNKICLHQNWKIIYGGQAESKAHQPSNRCVPPACYQLCLYTEERRCDLNGSVAFASAEEMQLDGFLDRL